MQTGQLAPHGPGNGANDFGEDFLRELFPVIADRTVTFSGGVKELPARLVDQPIYLRFDIDANFDRAHQMACLCNEYGVKATFFILNTASYFTSPDTLRLCKWIQDKGHEIAWHNNLLTEFLTAFPVIHPTNINASEHPEQWLQFRLDAILMKFNAHGVKIKGSASHGDPLCRLRGYINYEVFEECPRTQEAHGFKQPDFEIPKVSMKLFGLEWEAYHVPYDLYLSESGGKMWTIRDTRYGETDSWDGSLSVFNHYKSIQILIHPQHWEL